MLKHLISKVAEKGLSFLLIEKQASFDSNAWARIEFEIIVRYN